MARRKQAAADAAAMVATLAPGLAEFASQEQFVLFHIGENSFGFPLASVAEILRPPHLAHMPLSAKSLLGLANLRGVVLPVVGLRRLIGVAETQSDDAARIVVIDRAYPVGFLVDRIDKLIAVPADELRENDAGGAGLDRKFLSAVIKGAEGDSATKILDPERLLAEAFAGVAAPLSRPAARVSIAAAGNTVVNSVQRHTSIVSFDVGMQEYALPLDCVREIIPLPDHISEVPRAETAVLGVVTLRDRLLPLVSLRALLGLPETREGAESGKVIVLSIGQGAVGVVADRTREILRVDARLIDPAPMLLTRGAGEAEITSICRLEGGKRLVALLSPDRLFRSDLKHRVLSEQVQQIEEFSEGQTDAQAMADSQFVIFLLGDQEYGLPIAAVDEIARPPNRTTRLPKAPVFVEGVMNLRGGAVPIVDLRRRFDIVSKEPTASQRILVVAVGGGKTGFLVDGVSEVLKIPTSVISPAPEVSFEQVRLIDRVANLEAQGRMILLVDPTQLLDRVEADMLAKFDRANAVPASKAS